MRRSLAAGLLLCAVTTSCVAAAPVPQLKARTHAADVATQAEPSDGSNVTIELHAATRARYVPSLLGAPRPTLRIVVTNHGAASVDVSDLRVHLSASHEGVRFRCAEDDGRIGRREPSTIGPNGTFTFERSLDCALPLVGVYAVRVAVSFGRGPFAEPRELRSFTLTIAAPVQVEPRPIDGLPGLWASVGASNVLFQSEGHGRAAIALVNGSKAPIALPSIQLATRVYRSGTTIPCEGEPVMLTAPRILAPGAVHREPFDVSCLGLSVPGTYEIAARLILDTDGATSREVEVGRLRVDVTGADRRTTPWPPPR